MNDTTRQVGGPAKSQLVHEVDALGGEIGKMADKTYLQKRVLNASRGPAVWALRAQTDKWEYSREMRLRLERQPNLSIREGMVTELMLGGNDDVAGVRTFFGMEFRAAAVVLTTGTFMSGQIWVGRKTLAAGRAGEAPSEGLTENLVVGLTCLFNSFIHIILPLLHPCPAPSPPYIWLQTRGGGCIMCTWYTTLRSSGLRRIGSRRGPPREWTPGA